MGNEAKLDAIALRRRAPSARATITLVELPADPNRPMPMTLRLRRLLLALSVVAILSVAAAPRWSTPPVALAANAPYSPTEILVRFRPGASNSAIAQSLAAEGAQAQTDPSLAKLGYTLVTVPEGQVLEALTAFSQDPAVEKAEPNYLRTVAENGVADTIPTDPSWASQYGPVHIQAPQVWDILTGTSSVVIAIIDTGVDLAHPDLAAKIWTNSGEMGPDGLGGDKRTNGLDDDGDGYIDDWRGWDFTSSVVGDNNPQDGHGHGTHVAGIAGAATNNGIGIAGVNWNAPLMVVRVLDSGGNGSDAEVAAGIVWATDRGAKILNLSLGGTAPNATLEAAVDYAYNHGALVVAAAGNTGALGVIYPAAYAHALAIANTTSADVRASSSTYGPEVDLAAPGTGIYSTYWTPGGSTYGTLTGTSMATPHVAGVAALLAALPQFNTPDKIRVALESTALDRGPIGWDQEYGYGIIQAYAAALFDADTATPTPTAVPPVQYALDTSDSCPGGVSYAWQSAGGGTNLNLAVDDGAAAITLPFPFSFNGQAQTSALVSTNGYLTFGGSGAVFANAAIPNAASPNDFIAPFWDDLDLRDQGAVYSLTVGSAPNRQLIVEWSNVKRYSSNSAELSSLTLQAVLYEGSHNILMQYHTLTTTTPAYATGSSATVGLELAGGTSGVQHSYNTADSLHAGLALLFTPDTTPAPDCTADPTPTPVTWLYIPFIDPHSALGH